MILFISAHAQHVSRISAATGPPRQSAWQTWSSCASTSPWWRQGIARFGFGEVRVARLDFDKRDCLGLAAVAWQSSGFNGWESLSFRGRLQRPGASKSNPSVLLRLQVDDGSEDDKTKDEAQSTAASSNEWLDWQSQSVLMRHTLQMPADCRPWTEIHRLDGVPRGRGWARYEDLIQVAYWDWLRKKQTPESVPVWSVDISQSVERRPWGEDCGIFTQSSLVYDFGLDRVLDGEECHGTRVITTGFFLLGGYA